MSRICASVNGPFARLSAAHTKAGPPWAAPRFIIETCKCEKCNWRSAEERLGRPLAECVLQSRSLGPYSDSLQERPASDHARPTQKNCADGGALGRRDPGRARVAVRAEVGRLP